MKTKREEIAEYKGAFKAAAAELERIINDPDFVRLRSMSAQELTEQDKALLERANKAAKRLTSLRQERPRSLV